MATEITELIQIPPNKKVVIDFYATWCGPCARVTPIIDELAEKYEDIKFLKVNVDQADEIAEGFEIGSLPTFVYLNLGNIVNRIEGADLNNILRSIEKLDQIVNPDNENDDNNDEDVIEEPVISEVKKEERRVKREVRRDQITESNIEPRVEPRKEERKESKSNRREPREERREERRVEKREETREERIQRKRLEMGLIEKEENEEKPSKKIEMKIAEKKSREIEKKKSKKKSSKESQKKAERRNFNDVNPYEIEYNNDTPEISSDSDNISVSS
jgi:thioredoxin 1